MPIEDLYHRIQGIVARYSKTNKTTPRYLAGSFLSASESFFNPP